MQHHLILLLLVLSCACTAKVEEHQPMSLINTAHIDHLYDEIRVGDDSVGVIHIYSEYPDYHFVDDADEGFTCVDDVGRAAIFYARQFKRTGAPEYARKMKMLTRYIFALQAENGYFYNFVWPDGTINREGITSKPTPDWWSWRALWTLGEVYEVLSPRQQEPMLDTINQHRVALLNAVMQEPSWRSTHFDTIEGIVVPTWLPEGSAADEAAILLCGLTDMYRQHTGLAGINKDTIASMMRRLASGIMMMQVHQPDSAFNGAFLSSQNLWHAYGQAQSYALLRAGKALGDNTMIRSALAEMTVYYPSYLRAGGWEHYFLAKNNNATISRRDLSTFPQIAYAHRPAIWACTHAMAMGGDTALLHTALSLGNWFFGQNPATRPMYDPMTGRCFDGINSATDVNQNAGAESTIEALLAMQALEQAGIQYDPETKRLVGPSTN